MTQVPSRWRRRLLTVAACGAIAAALPWLKGTRAQSSTAGGISSSPIVLDSNDQFLLVVNPDNNTLTAITVGNDNFQKLFEIPTGKEPQSVALSKDNTKAYVANAVDGTVTIHSGGGYAVVKTIRVGTEPWAVAITPNGRFVYVANSSSNTVSVIDTTNDQVVRTIYNVGIRPRAIAITDDGDTDDNDEKIYVASFLAQYRPGEIKPGADDGKVGLVSVISTQTNKVEDTIQLQPLANTGFQSNGSALAKVPPSTPPTLFTTGAFPNILAGLAIKNNRLYVPSTGSSPNGPDIFNVTVQGLVSVVETFTDTDTGKTVNLNNGIQNETDSNDASGRPLKRFVTNPYYLAFRHNSNSGYIISAASDMAVKVDLDAGGVPTINAPANVKRILAGKNPRAMAINSSDTRGYIWNYVSRDVTIVNLTNDAVINTIVSAAQTTSAQGITAQRGKELFNTSIGPIVPKNGVNEGLMSDHGWMSCASCHPDGLTDGNVWFFASGPRFATPLNSTFSKGPGPIIQRPLNWSAIFDEVADFELNTRNTAGGRGLILLANGTPDPTVRRYDPPSAGRNADRDSITEYLKFGIRAPISPIDDSDTAAQLGRRVFKLAGCVQCHNGPLWTSSKIDFTPPPAAGDRLAEFGIEQMFKNFKQVGTFNAADPFEVLGNSANMGKQALGQAGFNPPSLIGVFAFGPYLHNGTVVDLEDILNNPTHVGTSPFLSNTAARKQLVRFLKSIDDSTPPFP